jgi:mannan endo-1,4-beta-mannosidase
LLERVPERLRPQHQCSSDGARRRSYSIINQWNTGFQVALSINNMSTADINGWTLTWSFADGQTITQLWNGQETQSVAKVTVNNLSYNATIPAGGSYSAVGFIANWNGSTNSIPTAFSLNGVACN